MDMHRSASVYTAPKHRPLLEGDLMSYSQGQPSMHLTAYFSTVIGVKSTCSMLLVNLEILRGVRPQ